MKIYPNPTRSTAYISIPSAMKKGGRITITNKVGDIIEVSKFTGNSFQLIPIDLSEQPNGFYKISLMDDISEVSYELLNLSQN